MSVYPSLPCRLLWVDLPCSNLLHRDQLGEEGESCQASAPYSSYRLQSSSSGLSGGACVDGGGSGADSGEAQQVIDSRGILD